MYFLILISLFLVSFLQVGCSIPTLKDPNEIASHTYRKDLKFMSDGKMYTGIGVLPRKSEYELTFYPKDTASYVIIQTRHRDDPIDKPKTGWFSDKFVYKYKPQVGVETIGASQLEIATLNEKQKYDAFAFIDFQDERPEISLPANLKCNGKDPSNVTGVSICQTAKGLLQEISFNQKVLIEPVDGACTMPKSQDGKVWQFVVDEGECSYYFTAREKHKNGERLSHRFTTIGYTKIGVN